MIEKLRVVIEQDVEDGFVAQCVDYDILGVGPTKDAAIHDFGRAFMAHVVASIQMGEAPFEAGRMKAPPEYAERWEHSAEPPEEFEMPRFVVQPAGFDDGSLPKFGQARVA